MYDLAQYFLPVVKPGQTAGRPVGVTHFRDGQKPVDGIFQAQLKAVGSSEFWQVKGAWNNPPPASDVQEHAVTDDHILFGIDTSRPASDGGPYTLYDTPNARGSKWAKRHMSVGEVFERNAYVSAFDMATGRQTKVEGPVRSWLKLAKHHDNWRGVPDVLELHWLVNSPADTRPYEVYYYGKGLGLIGYEGPGHQTYPNSVFPDLPPATGIPVLRRKGFGFSVTPLPTGNAAPAIVEGVWFLRPTGFPWLVNSPFGYRERPEPKMHEGPDYVAAPGAVGPFKVIAPRNGIVTKAGWTSDRKGYGLYVRINHMVNGEEWVSWLGHLSEIFVREGDQVTTGQVVGYMGSTGNSTGLHLHWTLTNEARGLDGYSIRKALDPSPYVVATIPTPAPIPEPPVDEADTQPTQPIPATVYSFALPPGVTPEQAMAVLQVMLDSLKS